LVFDSKKEREYVLLRSYQENIVTRGFLLRIPFVALKQIENDSWDIQIPDNEKPRVRSLIQIDIISKIMMYIEDLAILALAFESNKNFYELLIDDTLDVGGKTGEFVNGIDSFTDSKILQIMSYADANKIGLDDDSTLFERHFNYHLMKTKEILNEIGSFSKSNYLIYKRFKHAGMPILSNSVQIPPRTGPFSVFEVFNIVAAGTNPLEDILVIPYSKHILKRYEKIIEKLQILIQEMVKNA